MPPSPKLYTATINGEEITLGVKGFAKIIGFTTMSLRRNLKLAGGNMQKALKTTGSRLVVMRRKV